MLSAVLFTAITLAKAVRSDRVIRAIPNTPALIGEGIAGLFASNAVFQEDRAAVERVLEPTGETLWVDQEADLDAVTALSGSGPAYVFLFLEAMVNAAVDMGLRADQGRRLAEATFKGAAALSGASHHETLKDLRARVTSKGGTTHAALCVLEEAGLKGVVVSAVRAAQMRARELAAGG